MKKPFLIRSLLFAWLSLCSLSLLHATHNRAGEIRVQQIGNSTTVEATVVTYTAFQGNSRDADRDSVRIVWGDGSEDWLVRVNGPVVGGFPNGEPLAQNIKKNIYIGRHTYSGRGRYVIGMQDPNRVDNILNINNGGSTEVRFYIRTVFSFLDPNFQGPNSTPELLQPPIDEGCVNQLFTHNPNAFDPDGDSLAYRLGIPLEGEGVPVVNYQLPSEFSTSAGNSNFVLDERSGTIIWNRPRRPGDYNVVILVISYRNGIAIDTTVRDMQITIRSCDNRPPEIEVAREFCLLAGDSITIQPIATAPLAESDQQVTLEATSATLDQGFFMPANWDGDADFHPQPWQRTYSWRTACEHSARFPYRVIFRATDDFDQGDPNIPGSSWLEVVNITVSAPPPQDLQIVAGNGLVDLSWEAPYACEDAADEYFFGFSVWRREGSNPFPIDSCVQGLAGRGYTRIANRENTQAGGRYVFSDDNIERGRTYCYRVLAQFVRYTSSGRPFNLVESIPSLEVCVQSSRDIPLLTKADVLETDLSTGQIDVRWTAPLASDLDTNANPGPYSYQLLRSPGIGTSNFSPIPGTLQSYPNFAALTRDTQYIDSNLDTRSRGYTYAVQFGTRGQTDGLPPLPSSTVFLEVLSSDRQNQLQWRSETSWENVQFTVLRDDGAGFDTIARVNTPGWLDSGLENGREYCYQIVSFGTYGTSSIYRPLINRSQQACGVPLDTIGPCAPDMQIQSICDNLNARDAQPPYSTFIRWRFGAECEASDDLRSIRVYAIQDSNLANRQLLGEVDLRFDSLFQVLDEEDIARCYAISAVDSLGNEGPISDLRCVSNCPLYVLPNVFTPNGDGQHDVLRPRINRFVERIDIQVFDRWGVLVYESEDPELGWDGSRSTGDFAVNGTYFYTCRIFERLSDGTVVEVAQEPLSGYIELLR